MSNYNFVMPYCAEMEAWLIEKSYPHPAVKPLNRLPSKQDVIEAIRATNWLDVQDAERDYFFAVRKNAVSRAYEIQIRESSDCFTMKGYFLAQLYIIEMLSHKCGQLLIHPDTGRPAVIVEPGIDIEATNALWEESKQKDDSWKYFFTKMYS